MDPIPAGFRKYLVQYYNEGELRDLCFDLGIDYDNLPAVGNANKARELIAYCARFGRMSELVTAAQEGRPAYIPPPASNSSTPEQPASSSTTSLEFVSCFISYSTKDEAFAKRLHGRMQQEHLRVWFAPDELKGGHKLRDQIDNAIRLYDKLLLILSDASMVSDWVAHEISRAYNRERAEGKRVLFPIRLCDFEALKQWRLPDDDIGRDLAAEVRQYYIPDFSTWKNHDAFEATFARLYNDLKASTQVQ